MGSRILQFERVDAFLPVERVAADLTVAEIELGEFPILDEVVLRLQGFGQDHVGMADVIEVNAGRLRIGGQFSDGPVDVFTDLGVRGTQPAIGIDVGRLY